MQAGVLYDSRISNAEGGGGMGWLDGLFKLVGGAINSGFQYGAATNIAKQQTEQARIAGLASQIQAGYDSIGKDTSSELLAAALGNRYNQPQVTKTEDNTQKYIWLALIAAVAVVAVVFINKKQ